MLCPECGHEERSGTYCSQCGTPLQSGDEQSSSSSSNPNPVPPKKPSAPPPPPKEGKHRPRPLHDLDLTLPELEVQALEAAKPEKAKGPAKAASATADRKQQLENSNSSSGSEPGTGVDPVGNSRNDSKTGNRADFSSFVLSLAASALIAMGEVQVPGIAPSRGSAPTADLGQARELINLLSMLEVKTKGNLTGEESEVLQHTLYTLRTKYVKASRKI
jgi:Domain of unknown function (DUF1844)